MYGKGTGLRDRSHGIEHSLPLRERRRSSAVSTGNFNFNRELKLNHRHSPPLTPDEKDPKFGGKNVGNRASIIQKIISTCIIFLVHRWRSLQLIEQMSPNRVIFRGLQNPRVLVQT